MSDLSTRPMRQPVLGLPDPGEKVPPLAWPTVALYVGTLALFAVEVYGVLGADWSLWLTVPMGAAVTFLMFSVLHESTHHAISTNTRVNNAFGHLSMPFVAAYTTFPMLKFIHIEHHRNTNEPMTVDPDNWTSGGPWFLLLGATPDRASAQRPIFHPLRVRSVESLTADSKVVTFDVPADLAHEYRYVQGQHLTLRAIVDGADVRRSYSIVEPVSANTLRVAVKHLEGGVFSTYVNHTLQPGDILDVMSPTGRFHTALSATAKRSYVAVAAGSGITPLLSIIATTLEVEPESTFTLVFGNRTPESTMFREELARFDRLIVHHVPSRTPDAALAGRITPELVRSLAPASVDAWFPSRRTPAPAGPAARAGRRCCSARR